MPREANKPLSAMIDRLKRLSARLPDCIGIDRVRLGERIWQAQSELIKRSPNLESIERLEAAVAQSLAQAARRRENLPQPRYPLPLPVIEKKARIAQAIRDHQVIILSGETGSGKTTQAPKICLELGLGAKGLIGLTQPRRIAARAIAQYIAEDLGSEVGDAVGYKVRFSDRIGPESFVKVMTDGILLAETRSDPLLRQYEALIIDEAHERGLNVDFLLGLIKRILPQRPDLKVIISSATLDTEKFARHFDAAPIIEVSGRLFPVQTLYRPLPEGPEDDPELLEQGVVAAVAELGNLDPPGDILVFLPGERQIRELSDTLRQHHPPATEILPLYARLSAKEQQRIFSPTNRRRIILATNVAETSITVPGIRYVVDSGLARISRFSSRSRIQRLPIEKVSRSSADQRQGRCGRVADGVCIRLYSEDDYLGRPQFTDPEILRASLAAVILRMKDLALGAVDSFPFVDPPQQRAVRDGLRLLRELGALDRDEYLTDIGRELAGLPVDPRLGRMLLAGLEQGALAELLVLAAVLHIQDPREQPAEKRAQAQTVHRAHDHPQSDFLGLLNLWSFIEAGRQDSKSNRKFKRLLQENFLSVNRVREWRDIHHQLSRRFKEMGRRPNREPATYEAIHKALLAGLLGHVGLKTERREYTGARQIRFHIFPGSGLRKKPPLWIVAAELTQTSRLFARVCARIEPEWVEEVAGELCEKSCFEPRWDPRHGHVIAWARIVFQGIPLVQKRKVHFGPIDPPLARRIFIQSALVEGRLKTQAPFARHNQALVADIQGLVHRSRRSDLLTDDGTIYAFFEARLPEGIYTARAFDQWRRRQEKRDPAHLFLNRDHLLKHADFQLEEAHYPGHLTVLGAPIPLTYQFNPGHESDGIVATIPLSRLHSLPAEPFEWLVPGLLPEKILGLLKSLPKGLRRPLVPLNQAVRRLLETPLEGASSLIGALSRRIFRLWGVEIPPEAWRPEELPDHLAIAFAVVDDDSGSVVASGKNLEAIRRKLTQSSRARIETRASHPWEKTGLKTWNFGPLPDRLALTDSTPPVYGYPALADGGDYVNAVLVDAPERARCITLVGLRRLFLLQLSREVRQARKAFPLSRETCLAHSGLGTCETLYEELLLSVVQEIFLGLSPPTPLEIDSQEAFEKRLRERRGRFPSGLEGRQRQVEEIFARYHQVRLRLGKAASRGEQAVHREVIVQLERLIYPGFLLRTPPDWLGEFPRYFDAILVRLERAVLQPGKDAQRQAELTPFWRAFWALVGMEPDRKELDADLASLRWMLEEFRVSLFAQELRTRIPVSAKRLRAQWLKAAGRPFSDHP